MGKTFHPYFVGQNSQKKVFRPWYRPNSEASLAGEAAADDAVTDDADPDQSNVVVRPLETNDFATPVTPGEKVFRSVSLAEMRARHNNVRSVKREEIMRPREVRPWFRPGDPRAVEYQRTKSNTINQPGGIKRLYPEYYHGLIDDTFVRITSKMDNRNTKLRLIIGPTEYCSRIAFENLESHKDSDFDGGPGYEVAKLVLFKKGEEKDIVRNKFPNHLLGDAFDHVRLEVQGDRTIRLRLVEIKLNGITILKKNYDDVPVSAVVLDEAICLRRLQYVDHSTNQIIRVAAGEIGKSWCPRYGNTWEKMSDPKPIWCSEFASWAFAKGTNNRRDPRNVYGNNISPIQMIQYFLKHGGYMTSNKANHSGFNPALIYACTFDNLIRKVETGYYIPMFGGIHSGIFVKWLLFTGPIGGMITIEGNNGDLVNIAHRMVWQDMETINNPEVLWNSKRKIYFVPPNTIKYNHTQKGDSNLHFSPGSQIMEQISNSGLYVCDGFGITR